MHISPFVHAIKITFQIPVTPERSLERFVYSYVVGCERTSLIDSGVSGSEAVIFETLKHLGRSPSDVESLLLTHSHPDHIGGARAIKAQSGCTVLAHPDGRKWIENVDSQFAARPVPGFHTLVGGSVDIDGELHNRETILLADMPMQVIFTPGHSACSVSLFSEKNGILFTGDAIPQADDLPIYADAKMAVESIRLLRKVEGIKTLLSSWSDPAPEDPYDVIDRGIEYFQHIHAAVRKASRDKSVIEPMVLCRDVVTMLGLPELAVNPLVAGSLYSHMKCIDEEHL